MTPDQIGEWVSFEVGEELLPKGFEGLNAGIIGVVDQVFGNTDEGPIVLYDYWKLHTELMAQNPEWDFFGAVEWLDYNTIGSMPGQQVAVGQGVPAGPRMTAEELVEKMGGADSDVWDLTPADLAGQILEHVYD